MIGHTNSTGVSGDCLNVPVSPSRTSHSQASVTEVPSAEPSPMTDSGFEDTRESLDEELEPRDDLEKPLRGWPQLAKLISVTPDFEAFPAFTDLNLKSLLYYQAELTILRKKLHAAEYDDYQTLDHDGLQPRTYANRLDKMFLSRNKGNLKWQKQWVLIKQIRDLLKEYNDALIQYSQVSALPKADGYNVESLRVWLRDVGDYPIDGPGSATWGDLKKERADPTPLFKHFLLLLRGLVWTPKPKKDTPELDLVIPRQGHKVDGLTRWVANDFVPFYQSLRDAIKAPRKEKTNDEENVGSPKAKRTSLKTWRRSKAADTPPAKDPEKEEPSTLNTYSEDRMLRFTSSVATVVACLLPTVAIAVLAKLHSTGELIGVIAIFTAVFAIGLMFLTDAGTSRVEIFTATAAFSAVMVVFVQNQNGTSSNGISLNGTSSVGT